MPDTTPRLLLPYILPGQAQKELFHNESLLKLDIILAASVDDVASDNPPSSPLVGSTYLVGTGPTGAWAGRPTTIAGYDASGWRFVAPIEGWSVWVRSQGMLATFVGGAWESGWLKASRLTIGNDQVVGSRAAAIGDAAGGTVIDAEARSSIASILTALRDHGLIAR